MFIFWSFALNYCLKWLSLRDNMLRVICLIILKVEALNRMKKGRRKISYNLAIESLIDYLYI